MNALILYATKSGASEECAKLLAKELGSCTLMNLEEEKPVLALFDLVIVGAGVRNDKMYKLVRDFLKKNQSELLSKKLACFLCNSKSNTTEAVIVTSIPEAIREVAIQMVSFGGYKPSWVPVSEAKKLRGIELDKIAAFAHLVSNECYQKNDNLGGHSQK